MAAMVATAKQFRRVMGALPQLLQVEGVGVGLPTPVIPPKVPMLERTVNFA
jgi:hypothetical protein